MLLKWIRVFFGTTVLFLGASAIAAENPNTLTGGEIVTAEQAKQLVDRGAQVYDVRTGNEFAEQHIKGAILLTYKEKSEKVADFDASADRFDVSKLPADKNTDLIFYCNGTSCWKSYKASVVSIKAGYKKIHWLRGGIPEWKSKGLPVE